ncbi:MAG: hypothetical protein IPM97_17655 [Bdellovibrionaceae bacterium]|nr:hypothetical protein [Pseudobdellovibrionaceae bacterium]
MAFGLTANPANLDKRRNEVGLGTEVEYMEMLDECFNASHEKPGIENANIKNSEIPFETSPL